MKTPIDLATWPRLEHFEFFKQYDMPFFGITAQLDCTRLYDKSKKEGFPFSAGYHFASLQQGADDPAFEVFYLAVAEVVFHSFSAYDQTPEIHRF